MSTSIILLDQNSDANNADIMVLEPSVLFPPPAAVWWGGGVDDMVPDLSYTIRKLRKHAFRNSMMLRIDTISLRSCFDRRDGAVSQSL